MNEINHQSTVPREELDSIIHLYSKKDFEQAIKKIDFINQQYPNVPFIYNIAGACYIALGNVKVAVKMFKFAIQIKPDYAEAHKNLGITFANQKKYDNSIKSLLVAISLNPSYFDAYYYLGNTYKDLTQFDNAVESYEKAISLKPDFAEAYNNLGNTYKDLTQFDNAVESYEKAISLKPDFAEAYNNLGILLKNHDQYLEARNNFQKVIELRPNYAEAHNNLGLTLMNLGQFIGAHDCYKKAISINPNYSYSYNNLGTVLSVLGKTKAAIKSYENAIKIKPDYAEAYNNLGNVLRNKRKRVEALECFEKAYSIKPEINYLLGAILNTKMHLCIWDDFELNLIELALKISQKEMVMGPFALKALVDDPSLQKQATEIFVNDQFKKNFYNSGVKFENKNSKIRVGYFSADYKIHPTSYLCAELFETHDRNKFEIHAFSYTKRTKDKMNLRIKEGVDYFHDVLSMSNEDLVKLSRSLKIDIAVDLGGYTANSRTKVFAMSLAPIQVNYLGYPGSMHAEYIDYLVADLTLIPKNMQKYYSEKIVYMPDSYQVNISNQTVEDAELTRQELDLPEKGFVFCCFNNAYKITPSIFSIWMNILKQVDGSVLWLLVNNETSIKNLKKEANSLGIDAQRLVFAPYISSEKHLNRIRYADLFLDTLPYNAHTTSSDALRMGLPVLTNIGKSFASRVAASLLNAVGMTELITTSDEDYASLAIELALNPKKYKSVKDKLVSNISSAPLFKIKKFTKHLESAYLEMYDKNLDDIKADHIYIKE